jgi:hypothetical protein
MWLPVQILCDWLSVFTIYSFRVSGQTAMLVSYCFDVWDLDIRICKLIYLVCKSVLKTNAKNSVCDTSLKSYSVVLFAWTTQRAKLLLIFEWVMSNTTFWDKSLRDIWHMVTIGISILLPHSHLFALFTLVNKNAHLQILVIKCLI